MRQLLDREHHDVLRISYKGRNLLRLAQLIQPYIIKDSCARRNKLLPLYATVV